MNVCASCGGQVPVSALLCPQCGRPNVSTTFATQSSSDESLFGRSSWLFAPSTSGEQTGGAGVRLQEPSREVHAQVALQPMESRSATEQEAGSAVNVIAPRPYEENTAFSLAAEHAEPERPEEPSTETVDLEQLFAPAPPPRRPITMASGESTHLLLYPNYPAQQEAPVVQVNPAAQQGWQQAAAQSTARHAKPASPPVTRYEPYAPGPYKYRRTSQVRVRGSVQSVATTAFLLELLGYLGILGLGHIYAGRPVRGTGLLIGWWVYSVVTLLLIFGSQGGPGRIGCCFLILYPLAPILSAVWIRMDVEKGSGT